MYGKIKRDLGVVDNDLLGYTDPIGDIVKVQKKAHEYMDKDPGTFIGHYLALEDGQTVTQESKVKIAHDVLVVMKSFYEDSYLAGKRDLITFKVDKKQLPYSGGYADAIKNLFRTGRYFINNSLPTESVNPATHSRPDKILVTKLSQDRKKELLTKNDLYSWLAEEIDVNTLPKLGKLYSDEDLWMKIYTSFQNIALTKKEREQLMRSVKFAVYNAVDHNKIAREADSIGEIITIVSSLCMFTVRDYNFLEKVMVGEIKKAFLKKVLADCEKRYKSLTKNNLANAAEEHSGNAVDFHHITVPKIITPDDGFLIDSEVTNFFSDISNYSNKPNELKTFLAKRYKKTRNEQSSKILKLHELENEFGLFYSIHKTNSNYETIVSGLHDIGFIIEK